MANIFGDDGKYFPLHSSTEVGSPVKQPASTEPPPCPPRAATKGTPPPPPPRTSSSNSKRSSKVSCKTDLDAKARISQILILSGSSR